MKFKRALLGIAAMVVFFAVGATAQSVGLAIVGSSALFLEMGQASITVDAAAGSDCLYSDKTAGDFVAHDSRGTGANDNLNVWITWTTGGGSCSLPGASSVITIYGQTDSVVGQRCFFAQPHCTITVVGGGTGVPNHSANLLAPDTDTVAPLPNAIGQAINGTSVSVAATDITPPDGAFAALRAETTCGTPIAGSQYLGLGYNDFSTINGATQGGGSSFNVVKFNIVGNDPYSGTAIPAYTVVPVGAIPVVVFVNPESEAGFGSLLVQNINRATLAGYLDGTYGRTTDLIPQLYSSAPANNPVTNVFVREGLSGTYNTMEYNIPNNVENQTSQDVGLASLPTAPGLGVYPYFNCTAVGGTVNENALSTSDSRGSLFSHRYRAIGTGNLVKAVAGTGSGAVIGNNLGYTFWSAANMGSGNGCSPTACKYLTVDGVDPIQENWTDGLVPQIGNQLLPDVSLSHVRDGSYPIWNITRMVGVTGSSTLTAAQNLAAAAANFLSPVQPDFVPVGLTNGNTLVNVRSHFAPPGINFLSSSCPTANGTSIPYCNTPSNGDIAGGLAESGGDVGGMVYSQQADGDYNADTGNTNGNVAHRQ